jgi:hypothetical protein
VPHVPSQAQPELLPDEPPLPQPQPQPPAPLSLQAQDDASHAGASAWAILASEILVPCILGAAAKKSARNPNANMPSVETPLKKVRTPKSTLRVASMAFIVK